MPNYTVCIQLNEELTAMHMEIITLILSAVSLILTAAVLIRVSRRSGGSELNTVAKMINENQREIGRMQTQRFDSINGSVTEMNAAVDRRLEGMRAELERIRESYATAAEKLRRDNSAALERLRADNEAQLNAMRSTVDEKLQQTLESRIAKSFRLVNERLEQVYKGLGEMQTLAQGVGDLKKVLSNVKTRGILGEMQLGAILEQLLSPEQYEENIATVPGSRNMVEFAIKLPDRDGNITYMPIDSKFPADTYTALLDAYEDGDKTDVDIAAKNLRTRILGEAKDIHEKYVSPPSTTDFAIMFLPFEGLYAEAVNRGLIEELQNSYRVMLAGPSTMAAMLNAIRAGFKTLAIEKRSAEVWEILGGVKTEFSKFGAILEATQKRLSQANDELDKLVGVRTRAIVRKLDSVEQLESEDMFPD